ncbi:MAG: glycosyltransferase [Ketobacteraceae bacterium]|nr:glycosyltransferase [Ketobacteraceae bacterium]
MRICLITNTYLPHVGGVARSVDTLAEDLKKQGHDVLIIAPTFSDDDVVSGDDDNVVRVPAIQNFNGSDFSVRLPLPFQLTETLDEFEPDIVHSHHPFLLGDTALRIARKYRKPLVFTHHTLYERYTHYVPLDSEVMQQFAIHLAIAYVNLCDAVVAPSESIAELIRERGGEAPVRVIPTGVDPDFFRRGNGQAIRDRYGIPPSAKVIGHLGRLAEEKNLRYLAEAVSKALAQQPDAWFLLAGDGELKQELEAWFESRQQADRVIATGNCTGQTLADVYQAMDLFAFASHTETQGMVVTEAMAAANPVVALDASGVREVVRDGFNGRLLPASATTDEFSRALVSLLNESANERKSKQTMALKTANEFSREACAERMIRLYRSLVYSAMPDALYTEKRTSLDKLAGRLKAEWELLSEKSRAAAKTLVESADSNSELI